MTSDCLPDKGVLFVRLELADGRLLNLFHTHLQASYAVEDAQLGLPNFYVRIKQTLLMRKYLAEKMRAQGQGGELSLLVGDFNIDANLADYPAAHLEKLLVPEQFLSARGLRNEYDLFMTLFNAPQLPFAAVDLFFRVGGRHPVTYGDGAPGADGRELPADTVLTAEVDFLTKQCLDYIFQLEPRASRAPPGLGVDARSLRVEKFNENAGKAGHLSDHYGLSCHIVAAQPGQPNYLVRPTEVDFLSY